MSDIPVGSPPAPPGRHAAPSGWYADPVDLSRERYWDGWQWSRDTRPGANAAGPGQAARQPHPNYGQQSYASQGEQQYGQQQAYGQPAYPGRGQLKPVPCTDDGVRLAGWWWRVLAVLVDTLIVGVVVVAVTFPLWTALAAEFTAVIRETVEAARAGATTPPQPDFAIAPRMTLWLGLAQAGVGVAYNAVFLRLKSATPGKLICGLRVIPLQQGRFVGKLEWSTCVVRAVVWVLPNVSAYTFLIRLVDVIWPLTNPRKQAVHDLIAKTQVIRP